MTAELLCKLDELPDGQARGFQVSGLTRKVIVVRKGADVFGYLDACPHYTSGTPMAWRTDQYLNRDGTRIVCHSHGAQFDIESGECLIGPCLGRSLTPISLSVNRTGGLEAAVENVVEEFD